MFGLFSPLIPQEGLSRIARGRTRQSIIPDFMFQLDHPLARDPGAEGAGGGHQGAGKVATLGELKTVSFCPTYMFPGARKRGVELRSDKIQAAYVKKARDTDRDFCETAAGEMGPVETKLRSFPDILKLSIDSMGGCSADLHDLVKLMAESKVRHQARAMGREIGEEQYSSQITYLRRQLSVCCVRAVAECLHTRLLQVGQVGPGAAAANRRREMALAREEKGRRERAAHWLLHTRGQRVVQRGQFMDE